MRLTLAALLGATAGALLTTHTRRTWWPRFTHYLFSRGDQ